MGVRSDIETGLIAALAAAEISEDVPAFRSVVGWFADRGAGESIEEALARVVPPAAYVVYTGTGYTPRGEAVAGSQDWIVFLVISTLRAQAADRTKTGGVYDLLELAIAVLNDVTLTQGATVFKPYIRSDGLQSADGRQSIWRLVFGVQHHAIP